MIEPKALSTPMANILGRAGLNTTTQIHAAIQSGTLEQFNGIGPGNAARIMRLYTAARPGSNWGGSRGGGRPAIDGEMVEAKLTREQADTLTRLQKEWAPAGGPKLTRAAVIRQALHEHA
jgi:hypothetical protein